MYSPEEVKFLREFVLDEQDETYLQQFWENERMREAVKKVLFSGLYSQGTVKRGKKANPMQGGQFLNAAFRLASKPDFDAERVGEDVKALWEGLQVVENAFETIAAFKRVENTKSEENSAR